MAWPVAQERGWCSARGGAKVFLVAPKLILEEAGLSKGRDSARRAGLRAATPLTLGAWLSGKGGPNQTGGWWSFPARWRQPN